MSFNIVAGRLTATPDGVGWTQTYEFKPQDPLKFEVRGQLFAVISTSYVAQGVKAVSAGREILSRLHEEYFGKIEATPFVQLKQAVESVIKEFLPWGKIEIAAVALSNDCAYLCAGGGARISILRQGELTTLLRSKAQAVLSASGYLKDKDIILIGTGRFFEKFSSGLIRGALENKSVLEGLEVLAPSLHAQRGVGDIGVLVLSFEKDVLSGKDVMANTSDSIGIKISSLPGPSKLLLKKPTLLFRRLLEKNVYLRQEQSSPTRRVSMSVGVLLLFLLVVSIFFGIKQKRQASFKAIYEEKLSIATHQLEEAESLVDLSPERARELLVEARGKVLGLKEEGIEDPKLEELGGKIEQQERRILGEYKVDLQTFVDLSLLSSGFKGNSMTLDSDTIYVLDKEGKKVVGISIQSKRSEVLLGPGQIDKVEAIAVYAKDVFLLNSDGVFKGGKENKMIDPEWVGETLPYAYAANFYVLDKGASKIYRYARTDEGFGTKTEWLSSETNANFSQASSWVIDGSIWVLTQKGEILKFLRGVQQPFRTSQVYPELQDISAIYTNEELEFLYLLDSKNGRIVVVDKNGKYKAQYLSEKIKDTTALVVSEKEKRIILLRPDALLSLNIEHL